MISKYSTTMGTGFLLTIMTMLMFVVTMSMVSCQFVLSTQEQEAIAGRQEYIKTKRANEERRLDLNSNVSGIKTQNKLMRKHQLRTKQESKSSKSSKSMKGSNLLYEIWASDQSNSAPGQTTPGTKGSFLWIWDSESVDDQIKQSELEAVPLSCVPDKQTGPCDLLDIFPSTLERCTATGCTGEKLGDLDGFGRLHGVIKDSYNLYVTANFFAPGGGYVGVIDTRTKEAIALFRVTKTSFPVARSVHMSFWSADGMAIFVANLNGKMIERIDVKRSKDGSITSIDLNVSASVYLGKSFIKLEDASYFKGTNAFNRPLIGSVTGNYAEADTGDLTPSMVCKESGCEAGPQPEGGSRSNNVPICPISSSNNNLYVTLGGGGLFIIKLDTTPMKIIGEYGNAVMNGAGCGGVEANGHMFLNGGISASSSGAEQSTFTLYSFNDEMVSRNVNFSPKQNFPMPIQVFKDPTNTNTLGNVDGTRNSDLSGQLPNKSMRRDSHGAFKTIDGRYIHIVDRIQNVMEVFDSETYEHVNTYDLVSIDGKSGRDGPSGPCRAKSVLDDPNLILNDPAPDLFEVTPDGKYFAVALRGPVPVSVTHSAQGSCPGVGIIEITDGGMGGRLVDVLRTTNTVDNVAVDEIPGGHNYAGVERSDVHGAIVVFK